MVKVVKTAVAAGVNHFDNADVYGNGRAERILTPEDMKYVDEILR